MNHKKCAFTLAEALILLLIAALLAAAFVPVITRKHKEVAAHGKWICTLNDNGRHVLKTIINGKDSGFKTTSPTSYCTFTPPANVKEFTVKATGGGGGGAGGTTGTEEILYDSASDGDTFAYSVKQPGSYLIVARAGGGAGGGIGCGEADNYVPPSSLTFQKNDCSASSHDDQSWNQSTQSHSNSKWSGCNITTPSGDTSKYGYVDMEDPTWKAANNYKKLYQNDAAFTDKYKGHNTTSGYDPGFKYEHLQDSTLKERVLCFAEENWPFSKANEGVNVNKCWNFPGEGGKQGQDGRKAGNEDANSVELAAGQSIYINIGAGGIPTQTGSTERIKTMYTPSGTYSNKDIPSGGVGGSGGNTIVDYGTGTQILAGGRGGYARQREKIIYKDIVVYECPIVESTGVFDNYSYSSACVGLSQSSCSNKKGCVVNTHQDRDYLGCSGGGICTGKSEYSCSGSWTEETTNEDGTEGEPIVHTCSPSYSAWYTVYDGCSVGKHTGPKYVVDYTKCVSKVRPTYDFNIYGCVYTSKPELEKADYNEADYPQLVPTITLKGQKDSSHADAEPVAFDTGASGSGGYGLGNFAHNYLQSIPTADGIDYVLSFAGQAGTKGEATVFKVSYTAGSGGQAGSYINTMYKKLDKLKITIGRGGFSSSYNTKTDGQKGGDTIIKSSSGEELFTVAGGAGGKADAITGNVTADRYMIGGDGAPSPMESLDDQAKIIPYGGKSGTNNSIHGMSPKTEVWKTGTNLKNLLGLNFSVFQFVGGNPLDVTYGAGGGGGSGSKTEAGNGGVGAPGAVIIEW